MFASLFVALFILICYEDGIKVALQSFGVSIGIILFAFLTIYLICKI